MKRTLLFVPGNNPGMLLNADIHGSDGIILDLEDAVSTDQKDAARILVRNALKNLNYRGCDIIIRINPIGTDYWKNDLDEMIPLVPNAILLPKTCEVSDVEAADAYITAIEEKCGIAAGTVKIIPLIETALGLENSFHIGKASKRVSGLFLGAEDLTADMRSIRSKAGEEIFYSRTRIVSAARAADIDVYDTPFTDVNDDEGLVKDAQFAKELGFSGKASISPRHVGGINKVFSPSAADVEYAIRVLEVIEEAKAQGKGAISLNGKMIDAPIVNRAKQVLEMHKQIQGGM